MLRSCVMIIYRSARQNQAHSTQHDPYCSCPQIQQPILLLSPRLFGLSSQRCIMKWNMNKNMEQRGEKGRLLHNSSKNISKNPKRAVSKDATFQKHLRECLQNWCPQQRQISIFSGFMSKTLGSAFQQLIIMLPVQYECGLPWVQNW